MPPDRRRRVLALRFQCHDTPLHGWFGEPPLAPGMLPVGWGGVNQRPQPTPSGSFEDIAVSLAPETVELLAYRADGKQKAIASQAVVTLSHPATTQSADSADTSAARYHSKAKL